MLVKITVAKTVDYSVTTSYSPWPIGFISIAMGTRLVRPGAERGAERKQSPTDGRTDGHTRQLRCFVVTKINYAGAMNAEFAPCCVL